ncbi:NUCLEAR FUSION DEFECTIVE 4-like protein [Drosera capensis]
MASSKAPAMSSTTLQWLSLVAVIWLQSINGTNSNFPAYSSQLKQMLSLYQLQLNNLAFANDAGKLFGWFSGIAALYLPLWLVLLVGSSLGLVGYGIQYLFLTHRIACLSYYQIFFLTVMAGNSICWINTVCYIVSVRNFPLQRQAAVGLSTGYIGLSPVIYTAIVNTLSSAPVQRAEDYLLLNSILPLVVGLVAAPFVGGFDSGKGKRLEAGFVVFSLTTVATGVYAIISSSMSSKLPPLINALGVGLCMMTSLIVPLVEFVRGLLERGCYIRRDGRVCDDNAIVGNAEVGGEAESGVKEVLEIHHDDEVHVIATVEEIGVSLMLRRLNFWLYFFVYFLGATIGLVYLNNLGQIAQSRGFSNVSALVSFSSAFGFFGRLLPCFQHYIYSRSKSRVPGPASVAALMVPLSGAFFLLLNGSNIALYVSTALIGACAGAITSIAVSVTAELFGTKNFGVNHNIVVANIPMGSFVFGDMAAFLYRKGGHEDGGGCMGSDCYRYTFMVWGGLCTVGTIVALILHLRTRKFYLQRL